MKITAAILATASATLRGANPYSSTSGQPFRNPAEAKMQSCGENCLEMDLEMGVVEIPDIADHFVRTRSYGQNGVISGPGGPVIRVKAGDTLKVNFQNHLVQQSTVKSHRVNTFRNPDHTNLHTHGLYVSPGNNATTGVASDDVLVELEPAERMQDGGDLVVPPGGRKQFKYVIPSDHMPGTAWIHGHYHGSTTLQVAGGAAMPFVVEDPPNYLPQVVEDAEEKILMVGLLSNGCFRNNMTEVATAMGDEVFKLTPKNPAPSYWTPQKRPGDAPPSQNPTTGSLRCFHHVNGQHQPAIGMVANEWQRWRVVNTGITQEVLRLRVDEKTTAGGRASKCRMELLAKDAVYISDFPRKIGQAIIPAGGRADVMVMCEEAGEFEVKVDGDYIDLTGPDDAAHCLGAPDNKGKITKEDCPRNFYREVLATMKVAPAAAAAAAPELPAWSPARPFYQTNADPALLPDGSTCSCDTFFNVGLPGVTSAADPTGPQVGRPIFGGINPSVNNRVFASPPIYSHVSSIDQVQERVMNTSWHPYHQHVYPFQLAGGIDDADEPYFRLGDWHDVYMHEWRFGYYVNALGFTSDGVPPDTRNGTYWGGYEENVGPYLPSGSQDLSVYQRERTWTMRYTPRKFYGNLIVHCHILDHEDIGMMSLEYILPQRNATCMCDYNADLAAAHQARIGAGGIVGVGQGTNGGGGYGFHPVDRNLRGHVRRY